MGNQPAEIHWTRLARSRASRIAGLSLAAGLLGWTAHSALSWAPRSAVLLATPGVDEPGVDSDSDGLCDTIENQFLSSPNATDTDADGASDLLEVVVGTLPYDGTSQPTPLQAQLPSARVLGYLEGGNFHLYVAVYVPTGNIADIQNIGALLYTSNLSGAGPTAFDMNPLVLGGTIQTLPTAGGGAVISSDSWFPQQIVGSFLSNDSHFAEFSIAFNATVAGVPVADVGLFCTTASYDLGLLSLSYIQVKPGGGGSGAFRPLQPASLPPNWQANSACVVTTALVAVEYGSVMVLQAIAAECKPLPASLCSPATCNENVGRTLRAVDPCVFGVCH